MFKLNRILAFIAIWGASCAQAQLPFVKSRNFISLENWQFSKGIIFNAEKADFNDSTWDKVTTPHTYSKDAITEIGYYRGEAWYRSSVDIPSSMKGKRIFIRFEAVGQEATVYINEKQIGTHVGAYSAFCYEITNELKFDQKNTIAVNVTNAPNFKRIPVDDNLFNHYGGIYRPVQIFATPNCNITPAFYASPGVFIETKELTTEKAKIEVRTHVSNKSAIHSAKLSFKIQDAKGHLVAESKVQLEKLDGDSVISHEFEIDNPILWNGRKNPHLYSVSVTLDCGSETDSVNEKFGLKTTSVDPAKGFFLNGEPYRLYGVATHQEWKQCGPALSEENIRTDMQIVDEIGATGLRMSHYQHPDLKYQIADEKGILVWTEIPFVHDYSGREGENAEQQLKELIYQNYNHASIFAWGLWNEVRAPKSKNEPCVKITENLNKLAHQLDKTRLTTSASDRGYTSNMGNITNLQAWNKYFGWYTGKYEDLSQWLDEARVKHPEIAMGISEYGAGGNIFQHDRSKLDKPFGNNFPEQEQAYCHEIQWKILKDRPFVWCSIVWNLFDFSVAGWNRGGIANLNHKGLVTYDRSVKKDAFYFYKANWSQEPVLYIAERRNDKRTEATVNVKVYTNHPKVILYINDKKVDTQKLESDIHIVTFTNAELRKGENTIKVISDDKKCSDQVIWTLE